MKCDIYKSGSLKNAYLFVPSGTSPEEELSDGVLAKLGSLQFLKAIKFDADSPLIAANPKEVIENIEKHGFHVQGAEVRTTIKDHNEVSEAGAAIGGGILAASLGFGPIGAIVGAALGAYLASSAKGENNDPDA